MVRDQGELRQLRRRHAAEYPIWERVCLYVCEQLGAALRQRGLRCRLEHRAKETASLVRKMLDPERTLDLATVRDRAGVRVVTPYPSQVPAVVEVVGSIFDRCETEDKSAALGPRDLGYLGVHCDVVVPEGAVEGAHEVAGEPWCEIQVHTGAQELWAATTHPLVYKAPQEPPREIRRRLVRLLALTEIYDDTLGSSETEILRQPGYDVARMMQVLEHQLFTLTAHEYDAQTSRTVLETMLPLYSPGEIDDFEGLTARFVDEHRHHLEQIFAKYERRDVEDPLLFQPEAIAIFERIEADRYRLASTWEEHLPLSILEEMALIWGTTLE